MLKKAGFLFAALVIVFGVSLLVPGFRNKVKKIRTSLHYKYNETFANESSWLMRTEIGPAGTMRVTRFTSPVFCVDRIYKSMTGPLSLHTFKLEDPGEDSLIWLKSYSVDITDRESKELKSPDFMCHNNLDCNVDNYLSRIGFKSRIGYLNSRLFTLTEGQTSLELPAGFALPLMADQFFTVQAQVLNQNLPHLEEWVRHRSSLGYFTSGDAAKLGLKPLFTENIYIGMPATTRTDGVCAKDECIPATASNAYMHQWKGKNYTGHWVIKPGKDTFRCEVTNELSLPFSTTIHYIGVHVHPFVESFSLKDLTADSVIFAVQPVDLKPAIGLGKIGCYSSTTGIPICKDHKYELICRTNNTTGTDQDMMAVMLLYLYDKELEKILHP